VKELITMLIGVVCTAIFLVTFFLGEIVGLMVEAKGRRRWRSASYGIGFGFNARRRRLPSVSRVVLPAVTPFSENQSAFVYGESLKELNGRIEDFQVMITDFVAWNFFYRYPLAFRGVLCVVRRDGLKVPGNVTLVKWRSFLVDGFRVSDTLRQFSFPYEKGFSDSYALFGRGGFTPWFFTPDVRDLCMTHHRDIHCLWANDDEVVVLWKDQNPDRFADLVKLSLGIASKLADNLQSPQQAACAAG
jgi:hypothetical protein